jgi:hypothetical protein
MAKIRSVVTEGDRQTGYKRVQVLFGTNYFLEIVENDGRVEFLLERTTPGLKQMPPSSKVSFTGISAKYRSGIRKAHWNRNSWRASERQKICSVGAQE